MMNKKIRTNLLIVLCVLTSLAAFLPYIMPYNWEYTKSPVGTYERNMVYDYIGPCVWFSLLVLTMAIGRWNRKLLWLLVCFPIAFGYWLLYWYLVFYSWMRGGFAP